MTFLRTWLLLEEKSILFTLLLAALGRTASRTWRKRPSAPWKPTKGLALHKHKCIVQVSAVEAMPGLLEKHFGITRLPRTLREVIDYFRPIPDAPAMAPRAWEYRYPPPASQPQYHPKIISPISKNDYHLRDTRRQFPNTAVYTNAEIQTEFLDNGKSKQIEPFVMNRKYDYKASAPYLGPSASNPDFTMHGRE